VPGLIVDEAPQADELEEPLCPHALVALDAIPEHRLEARSPNRHHHVLEHRHALEHARDLKGPRQPLVHDATWAPAADLAIAEHDHAPIRDVETRDAVERGGLP